LNWICGTTKSFLFKTFKLALELCKGFFMKDVLIVGFGISGLSIAKRLEESSKTFDIISDESQQSSKVAGGVLNPIALKRYNLAWNAIELIPEAIKFYSQFNKEYSEPFFEAIPVYKLFSSIEDQNNWTVASGQPRLAPFVNGHIYKVESLVASPFKAGRVLQTYLLHLKGLIDSERNKYISSSRFSSESFLHNNLLLEDNHISYNTKKYRQIIFCEGYGVNANPFFNWLPIYGNKGEYLIFKSKQLKANQSILKSRYFIIPLGNDIYKYGATYSREQLDNQPTTEARNELIDQLSKVIQCDFEIIDQIAGVRPTVRDRKPILGQHPIYKNLYIINGFGSRGVMTAPTLSRELVEHIFDGKPIDKETDINRFMKFYS
jgi:glycine/D-amino acid oxidase-like deaminating enzyme